jgi:hypothetical protein
MTDSEDNVKTQRFFHRPCAQPINNRPLGLFNRCDKQPVVRARHYKGNQAEAEDSQPTVSYHGDAKVVAAIAARSAGLHQLSKAT